MSLLVKNSFITLATTNLNKVSELQKIFEPSGILLKGLQIKVAPPEEDGKTFQENADLKALYYSRVVDHCVLADDSGLCVDFLKGAPGIYSSRFASPKATDGDNIRKLLESLKGVESGHHSAHFICALSLAFKGRIIKRYTGKVRGLILEAPAGTQGFGYDPVFYYPSFKKSFAEMTREEKNSVSHRFRAARKMAAWVEKHLPENGKFDQA